jgi:hypothetical protein
MMSIDIIADYIYPLVSNAKKYNIFIDYIEIDGFY